MKWYCTFLLALTASAAERPNFVVILADDLGFGDIGAYRSLFKGGDEGLAHKFTPNLDKLATAGVRCTRAYCASWCAPSRQMLMSGQFVNRQQAYDIPWIGARLRKAGYVTGMVGKCHGKWPIQKAFGNTDPKTVEFDDGFWFNGGMRAYFLKKGEKFPTRNGLKPSTFVAKGGEYITDVFTDHAVEFIERNAERPFMLYLPYTAPHTPNHAKPEDLKKLFPGEKIAATGPNKEDHPNTPGGPNKRFAAMVYALDRGVGRVMDALKKAGVDKNTVVIFTSDNGAKCGSNYPLTGRKWDVLEGGIRVPFMVWSKAIAESQKSGTTFDELVSLADIAPTLAALGHAAPTPTDGANIWPALTGAGSLPKDRFYYFANIAIQPQMNRFSEFRKQPVKGKKQIHLSTMITSKAKIQRWMAFDTRQPSAKYYPIPRIADIVNFKEPVPVEGRVPVEGPGRQLYDRMMKWVRTEPNKILPNWSGGSRPKKK